MKVRRIESEELKFCSFDCEHGAARAATSASGSCMTFNAVYCKKLRRAVSKGILCPVKPKKKKK